MSENDRHANDGSVDQETPEFADRREFCDCLRPE